ncbi:DUF6221 family protein [Streptomyces sp. SM13]|uniref:DUF6221 family protein n=1 Tax=Streptomyces sp. SM13 TaxID=1983803 RepID=UPI000CD4B104|nr:DUF6221 family protein [Streptomyces sp. SM13]
MTAALVAFLRARLDDDERVARSTGQPGLSWQNFEMDGELRDDANAGTVAMVPREETRTHIGRQDPARTLREVEAARAVLDLYEEAGHRMDRAMNDSDTVAYQEARIEQRTLRKVLLQEAAVHEAHPEYLKEWRP